ncbi:hypothetical protein [Methylomonas albis]|uniref:Uncharacterized protein n=1 Tax=Methylomonas albis TaxID=1854563 RepID=A0ABR9CZF7_9GAMM|nr:hypothetical protein [Methylomonas albis]MBD9355931.1 hypothetical protein [Methylomonas albis]CAD6878965.1 hypothetical protein [Methylomonas albis]
MSNLNIGGAVARNFGGSWTHRRRIIYWTLGFCAFCILWLLFFGKGDNRLQETIAESAFFLAGGVIGSYVFGAVWDDKTAISSTIKTNVDTESKGDTVTGTDVVDDPDK